MYRVVCENKKINKVFDFKLKFEHKDQSLISFRASLGNYKFFVIEDNIKTYYPVFGYIIKFYKQNDENMIDYVEDYSDLELSVRHYN